MSAWWGFKVRDGDSLLGPTNHARTASARIAVKAFRFGQIHGAQRECHLRTYLIFARVHSSSILFVACGMWGCVHYAENGYARQPDWGLNLMPMAIVLKKAFGVAMLYEMSHIVIYSVLFTFVS